MLVYREQQHREPAACLWRTVRDRLTNLAPAHAGTHDRTVALLIDMGVLEAALTDALHPETDDLDSVTRALRAASVATGHLLWHSWRGDADAMRPWIERARAALDVAQGSATPEEITCRVPEGYAYYGLYPETYFAAAARLLQACPAPRLVCIGLRSIGTSLSAAAAAAFEEHGREVLSVTVRPHGHPFDRRPILSAEFEALLRARAGDLFVLVDEGPGLSGSSLAGAARVLEGFGVAPEQVVFLPSWRTDGAALRSAEARVRWRRHPQFTASFEEVWLDTGRLATAVPGPARTLENLSAGAWRPRLLDDVDAYPPVQPQHERRKYLACSPGGGLDHAPPLLLRFVGLGAYGERRLARARALAEAGLGSAPEGLAHGFLIQPFHEGRPGRIEAPEELLAAMANYLAGVRRHCPARENPTDLLPMVETNVSEGLGPAAATSARRRLAVLLPDVEPTALDARMFPHEWLRTAAGWQKADAYDHCDDHFYPGPQDIAWDLAGVCLEFRLSPDARRALLEGYKMASGDRHIGRRLPGFAVAYLAFHLGYDTLAAEQLSGTGDGERFQRRATRYRRLLARELSPGAEADWDL